MTHVKLVSIFSMASAVAALAAAPGSAGATVLSQVYDGNPVYGDQANCFNVASSKVSNERCSSNSLWVKGLGQYNKTSSTVYVHVYGRTNALNPKTQCIPFRHNPANGVFQSFGWKTLKVALISGTDNPPYWTTFATDKSWGNSDHYSVECSLTKNTYGNDWVQYAFLSTNSAPPTL